MPREFLVLCGGAPATRRRTTAIVPQVVLDAPRAAADGGNVHLRIDDITRVMSADLPDAVVDLVELATYVYCADQAISRGGKAEFEYGEKWRRRLQFRVPVRRPEVWRDPGVKDELIRTLGFLSDDEYAFEFLKRADAPAFKNYLWGESGPGRGEIDTVMMFSGGLDSLAGAVDEVIGLGRRVALVSHRPVGKIDRRQQDLVAMLGRRAAERGKSRPFHVPVWANKEQTLGREYTQRTRSFLFGALGVAVAQPLGLDVVKFYENGVVSLNLPVCSQVLGGRASRTTHPQTLGRMQSLFSRVLGKPFRVENPFQWRTKTEVTARVRAVGLGEMIANTVSCAHTWEVTNEQPHCGRCSQCIDRRLAAVAAGLSDAEDPAGGYRTAVLAGRFDDVEHRTMIERVIGMAYHVGRLNDPTQLFAAFGEASRALRYAGETPDLVATRVFDLLRRQAGQAREAVERIGTPLVDLARPTGEATMDKAGSGGSAAAAEDGADVADSDFTPNKHDVKILTALAAVATACLVKQIAGRAVVSVKTVGRRLQVLVQGQCVRQIGGKRSGYAITARGRALLVRVKSGPSAV